MAEAKKPRAERFKSCLIDMKYFRLKTFMILYCCGYFLQTNLVSKQIEFQTCLQEENNTKENCSYVYDSWSLAPSGDNGSEHASEETDELLEEIDDSSADYFLYATLIYSLPIVFVAMPFAIFMDSFNRGSQISAVIVSILTALTTLIFIIDTKGGRMMNIYSLLPTGISGNFQIIQLVAFTYQAKTTPHAELFEKFLEIQASVAMARTLANIFVVNMRQNITIDGDFWMGFAITLVSILPCLLKTKPFVASEAVWTMSKRRKWSICTLIALCVLMLTLLFTGESADQVEIMHEHADWRVASYTVFGAIGSGVETAAYIGLIILWKKVFHKRFVHKKVLAKATVIIAAMIALGGEMLMKALLAINQSIYAIVIVMVLSALSELPYVVLKWILCSMVSEKNFSKILVVSILPSSVGTIFMTPLFATINSSIEGTIHSGAMVIYCVMLLAPLGLMFLFHQMLSDEYGVHHEPKQNTELNENTSLSDNSGISSANYLPVADV